MKPPLNHSRHSVAESLHQVRRAISSEAKLVAVSKLHSPETILEAYEAGQRVFGESRAQELVKKEEELRESCPDISWHFIGHLQTNKVKYIAPFVDVIHSVDSLRLLEEINRQALRCGRTIRCLLEVRVAQEESKHGLEEEELMELLAEITKHSDEYQGIKLCGLMAIASHTEDEIQIEAEFIEVRHLFDSIRSSGLVIPEDFTELSMGMSGDYAIALRAGATILRIGSAIFGERDYKG